VVQPSRQIDASDSKSALLQFLFSDPLGGQQQTEGGGGTASIDTHTHTHTHAESAVLPNNNNHLPSSILRGHQQLQNELLHSDEQDLPVLGGSGGRTRQSEAASSLSEVASVNSSGQFTGGTVWAARAPQTRSPHSHKPHTPTRRTHVASSTSPSGGALSQSFPPYTPVSHSPLGTHTRTLMRI
jgi:hypothetical protein